MAMWFCRKCGMNVEENSTPRPGGCKSASNNTHAWLKVSGNTRFYCRKCHKSVVCDIAPHGNLGGPCSGSSSNPTHVWIKG